MRSFLLVFIFLFGFCHAAVKPLQFSSCVSPDGVLDEECNANMIQVLQERVVKTAFKNRLWINDSIFIKFKFNDSGDIKPLQAHAKYSQSFLRYNLIYLEGVKNALVIPRDTNVNYEWGYSVSHQSLDSISPGLSNEMSVPFVRIAGRDSSRVPLNLDPLQAYRFVVQRIFNSMQKSGVHGLFAGDLLFEKGYPVALKIYAASTDETDAIEAIVRKSFEVFLSGNKPGAYDDFRFSFFYRSFRDSLHKSSYLTNYFQNPLIASSENDVKAAVALMSSYEDMERRAKFIDSCMARFPEITSPVVNIFGQSFSLSEFKEKENPMMGVADLRDRTKVDPSEPVYNFAFVDFLPTFPGCEDVRHNKDELKECFEQNIFNEGVKKLQIPEMARQMGIEGRVYVNFIVEKDGSISNVQVVRGVDPLLDEEAVRMVKYLPKMKPALLRDLPVRMSFTLPINIQLE